MEERTILLCDRCIKAIRSRGEEVIKGNLIAAEDDDHLLECQWCHEECDELHECRFPDTAEEAD